MSKTASLPGLMEFAVELARRAGLITLEYFKSARLRIDYKADATPVTEADRRAEQFIREQIAERFADHQIVGEEFGERPGHPGSPDRPRYRWIIDPIDGTKSFVHGVPLYGVMIALEVDDQPSLGVLRFPALDETVFAGRGQGCWFNDVRCRVRNVDQFGEATLLASSLATFDTAGLRRQFDGLIARCKHFRTWGDCYGHAMVATGRADAMVDPVLELWDAAPLYPIVTEAGGRFTSRSGEATIHGRSGISTNGKLHDAVLAALAG